MMGNVREIDIHEAKDLAEKGDLTIVDIRDADSFKEAHLDHAISVNDSNIEDFLSKTNKSKPLLCYCYRGINSQSASHYFKDNGFETVYSMEGGFEAWRSEYPITDQV